MTSININDKKVNKYNLFEKKWTEMTRINHKV